MKIKGEDFILKCDDPNANSGWLEPFKLKNAIQILIKRVVCISLARG